MKANKEISDYYNQKIKGVHRDMDGITLVHHSYSSPEDKALMSRLINDIRMQPVWQHITNKQDQIIYFECAYQAALNYNEIRAVPKNYSSQFFKNKTIERAKTVKNLLKSNGEKNKRLVQLTAETAKKLSSLLCEIQALGNTGVRFPDKALNSPGIQEELALLIEKADNFDFDSLSPHDFVNTAIGSPEHNLAKEYLRGFVCLLDESGFCLKAPNYTFLAVTANVTLDIDEANYDTAYKIIKKYNSKK